MRRARLLLAALAAVMMLLATSSAQAQPLITGVTNLFTTDQLAFNRVHDAGASFVRIPLYWGGTAPRTLPSSWDATSATDPNYAWGETDEAVSHAVAAGLTPVLQIVGAPTWAQRCQTPSVLPAAICDPDPNALREFAIAVAKRYSGNIAGVPKVSYFGALNEPNLSLFFFPQFEANGKPLSPYLYRELVNSFYAGIKSVDSEDLVLLAGLGPIAVPKYTIGPLAFARMLLCMKGINNPKPTKESCGGGVHFDIFSIQPYTTGGPTHEGGPNDVEIGDLPKLQKLIKAADRAGRIVGRYKRTPLWVTEFSWDSKPPDPGGLPMKIETRWVPEAMHQAWSAGVDHFFWFSLDDEARQPNKPYSETLESGLYFRGPTLAQDTPKPFLQAFRFPFVAYPGKPALTYWGRTPAGVRGKVKIQLQFGKSWKTVATKKTDKNGIFQGKVKTEYGRDKKGAARAVFGKEMAPAFSMRPVKDFYHPPFG